MNRYRLIIFPAVLSLVIIMGGYFLFNQTINIPKFDLVFSSLITLVVTIVGFLTSSLFFLFGLSSSSLSEKLKATNHWRDLLIHIISPIVVGLILVMMLIIASLFANGEEVSTFIVIVCLSLLGLFITYFMIDLWIVTKFNSVNDKTSNRTKVSERDHSSYFKQS